MKSYSAGILVSVLFSLNISPIWAQTSPTQNQNPASPASGLSLSFAPVYSTTGNSGIDSLLFRGNGTGFRFGADYYFGKASIGFMSGFGTSSPDDATINRFLKTFPFSPDELIINKSKQQNMYLLLGPSLRFGKMVEFVAHAKAGLFINNSGQVSLQQKGAQRPVYRNEATDKSIYPGFLTGLGVQYKTRSEAWSFGIGADYLGTKSEVNNYDIRRGIEPLKLSRHISDIVTGITVRYNILSPRDHSSGQATGKRTRDAGSGMASGKRSRETGSGMSTGRRTYQPGQPVYGNRTSEEFNNAGCGPVMQRTTNPDGTIEEMTFSCPADAASYNSKLKIDGGMPNRISMNVTVPKQTQGATFGEKVNQGLQAPGGMNAGKQTQGATFGEKVNQGLHAAGSALSQGKNIISGNISWATEGSTGIITNKTVSNLSGGGSGAAAASYAATGMVVSNPSPGIGSVLTLYSREAGSGQPSGRRDKGSGMATGRRQYQPIYREGSGNGCDTCSITVKLSSYQTNTNPYFKNNNNAGDMVDMLSSHNNPMYTESQHAGTMVKSSSGHIDRDCDGIAGLEVFLKDAQNGAVLARTTTEAGGDFFFANVPDGDYVVALSGAFFTRKGYQYYMAKASDMMGTVQTGGSSLQVRMAMIATDTVLTAPAAQALIKTKTKSNQSNDRMAAEADEEEIWSPRSNITEVRLSAVDMDEKGLTIMSVAPPVGSGGAALRPGNPIGGLTIKAGRNPGGNLRTMQTNEKGEFEFTDLEPGDYTFIVEQQIVIESNLWVSAGKAQDHNSTRSNKTASGVAPDPGNGGGNKVQDHNSSRSNKTASIAAPDPGTGDNQKIVTITASQNSQSLRKGEVKITASQNSQSLRSIAVQADLNGDGVYETDVTAKVNDELIVNPNGDITEPKQKAGISTSRSNIRNRNNLQAVTQTIYTGYGTAVIDGKEVPVKTVYKVVEKATSGLKDTLKTQV